MDNDGEFDAVEIIIMLYYFKRYYTFDINLAGTPNGNEILTVTPVAGAAFDGNGNGMSSTKVITQ